MSIFKNSKDTIVFVLFFLGAWSSIDATVTISKFTKSSICNVDTRIKEGCSETITNVRTFLECLAECGRRENVCFGASFNASDPDRRCVVHGVCSPGVQCGVGDAEVYVWSNTNVVSPTTEPPTTEPPTTEPPTTEPPTTEAPTTEAPTTEAPTTEPPTTEPPTTTTEPPSTSYCLQGTWNDVTASCDCEYASTGVRCEQYPVNCDALYSYAEYTGGNFRIMIDPKQDGTSIMEVICNTEYYLHARTVLMANTGKSNNIFNKTWNEYENGFYDIGEISSKQYDNYWVGLKQWYIMNTAGGCTKLMVVVYTWYATFARKYFDFHLLSDTSYDFTYSSEDLTIYGYSELDPDDCLASIKNTPFSTHDKDSDGNSGENCAAYFGSGWWHSLPGGCSSAPCNLLGSWRDWSSTPTAQRLSIPGMYMDTEHPYTDGVKMFIVC